MEYLLRLFSIYENRLTIRILSSVKEKIIAFKRKGIQKYFKRPFNKQLRGTSYTQGAQWRTWEVDDHHVLKNGGAVDTQITEVAENEELLPFTCYLPTYISVPILIIPRVVSRSSFHISSLVTER